MTKQTTPVPAQTMQARFVRCGDVIDGHEVIDSQRFVTSFIGGTVEFYFENRAPLTLRLDTFVSVQPGAAFGPLDG